MRRYLIGLSLLALIMTCMITQAIGSDDKLDEARKNLAELKSQYKTLASALQEKPDNPELKNELEKLETKLQSLLEFVAKAEAQRQQEEREQAQLAAQAMRERAEKAEADTKAQMEAQRARLEAQRARLRAEAAEQQARRQLEQAQRNRAIAEGATDEQRADRPRPDQRPRDTRDASGTRDGERDRERDSDRNRERDSDRNRERGGREGADRRDADQDRPGRDRPEPRRGDQGSAERDRPQAKTERETDRAVNEVLREKIESTRQDFERAQELFMRKDPRLGNQLRAFSESLNRIDEMNANGQYDMAEMQLRQTQEMARRWFEMIEQRRRQGGDRASDRANEENNEARMREEQMMREREGARRQAEMAERQRMAALAREREMAEMREMRERSAEPREWQEEVERRVRLAEELERLGRHEMAEQLIREAEEIERAAHHGGHDSHQGEMIEEMARRTAELMERQESLEDRLRESENNNRRLREVLAEMEAGLREHHRREEAKQRDFEEVAKMVSELRAELNKLKEQLQKNESGRRRGGGRTESDR